jgi:hypothetical protein
MRCGEESDREKGRRGIDNGKEWVKDANEFLTGDSSRLSSWGIKAEGRRMVTVMRHRGRRVSRMVS